MWLITPYLSRHNLLLLLLLFFFFIDCEFFILALAGGLSPETEWQQVSLGFLDSSSQSQQYYGLYGFDPSFDL